MKDYSKIGDKLVMQRPRRRLEGTAMGATVFDLRPGVGIGPFSIGNCDSLKIIISSTFHLVSRIRKGFYQLRCVYWTWKIANRFAIGDCVLFWEFFDNIAMKFFGGKFDN